MILNLSARTTLELVLRDALPGVPESLFTSIRKSAFLNIPNGRVMIVDWTPATGASAVGLSIANTGAPTLSVSSTQPVIAFPSSNGRAAPGTTMTPKAMEAFLIPIPLVEGGTADRETSATVTLTGSAGTLASSKLQITDAGDIAKLSWFADQIQTWTTLAISGLIPKNCRFVAILAGAA